VQFGRLGRLYGDGVDRNKSDCSQSGEPVFHEFFIRSVRVRSAFNAVFLPYLFALYWIESFIVPSASNSGKNIKRKTARPITSKSKSIRTLEGTGGAFFLSPSKAACQREIPLPTVRTRQNPKHIPIDQA
jgi:hypothetical protein